ncbi:MAG: hypothetical protein IKN74_07365 [Clostridia bacterium]|nr:hypothetical protein [Clostridia bacterium]
MRNNCYLKDNYYEDKNNPSIKYSIDGLSWKQMYDIYDGNIEEVIDKLEIIRNPDNNYHFVWPRHKESINQKKYSIFNDRIDYTLFDIKCFFEGKNCRLSKSYTNPDTFFWLNYFKVRGKYNFNKLVEEMNLSMWCIKKNNNYEIIDLSDLNKVLNYNHRINKLDKKYIENVIQLVGKC